MPQEAKEEDGPGCSTTFQNCAQRRLAYSMANARRASEESDGIPESAVEAWRVWRVPYERRRVEAARVSTDEISAPSDDSSGPLQKHAVDVGIVVVLRDLEKLRQSFLGLSTDSKKNIEIMNSIKKTAASIKSGLAHLFDRADNHVDTLDLLVQSLDSQSETAHNLLLRWKQDLQRIRDALAIDDEQQGFGEKPEFKQQHQNQITQMLSAMDTCVRSTSILSHACRKQERLDAHAERRPDMRAECHDGSKHDWFKVVKTMQSIRQSGIALTVDAIDGLCRNSNSEDFEYDVLQRIRKMINDGEIPEVGTFGGYWHQAEKMFEEKKKKAIADAKEEAAKRAEKEAAAAASEKEAAAAASTNTGTKAVVEAAKNRKLELYLAAKVEPGSGISCGTDLEFEILEPNQQKSPGEKGAPLCARQTFSMESSSDEIDDHPDGQNNFAEPDTAAITVAPPKHKPFAKRRPSSLTRVLVQEQEEPPTTTTTQPNCSLLDTAGQYIWTIDKRNLPSPHLECDTRNDVNKKEKQQASQCTSRRAVSATRPYIVRGGQVRTRPPTPMSSETSDMTGRRPSLHQCMNPTTSHAQRCFTPQRSVTPVLSLEASRMRFPRTMNHLFRATERGAFTADDLPQVPRIPKLIPRRSI